MKTEKPVMDKLTKPLKLIIEAFLFASDKPITENEIHSWLPEATLPDVRQALEELLTDYDTMGRSFSLKQVASGYQFRTKAEYAPYVLQMLKTSPARLSRAAFETLAIIAYKQPILRQEIERLRGVDVGGILRTLLEKDLIRIMGRKNLPGKPLIYGTTKRFLEVFDLKNINSLPKLKEIKDLVSNEEQSEPTPEEERQPEESGEEKTEAERDRSQPETSPAPED
jgi:segregation and condensation protein B